MTTERFIKFKLLNSADLHYIQYIQTYNPHINILFNIHKNNVNFSYCQGEKLLCKGQVIRATFSFNLRRNIVALLVFTTACSTCHATNFSVATCSNMLCKVDPSSTFYNKYFQLATLKFVSWKVEHGVVIRATTLFSLQCNNVARQVERKCCPYFFSWP